MNEALNIKINELKEQIDELSNNQQAYINFVCQLGDMLGCPREFDYILQTVKELKDNEKRDF